MVPKSNILKQPFNVGIEKMPIFLMKARLLLVQYYQYCINITEFEGSPVTKGSCSPFEYLNYKIARDINAFGARKKDLETPSLLILTLTLADGLCVDNRP